VLQSLAAHRWNGAAAGPLGPFVLPGTPAALRSAA
jgi:hypothetical protein